MKRLIGIAVLCFVAMSGCRGKTAEQDAPVSAGGKLEVAQASFDAGVTARGDVIKHVFELRNVGDAPVKILEAKATCSCTAAIISDPVVAPGESGSVEVSFNTRGRKGPQSKTVKVFTDSPLTPWLALTVSGDIRPALGFSEETVQFGQVARGTVTERELDLIGLRSEGVTITGLTLTPAGDTRLAVAIVEGSGSRKLKVTFKSDGNFGFFRGNVDVATTSTEFPTISFSVGAEVTGDIVSTPRAAVFPPPGRMIEAGRTTQTAQVVIKSLTGKAFKVKRLRPSDVPVTLVSAEPVQGGVRLTLEGPLSSTPSEATVVVELDGADPFELKCVIGRTNPRGNGPRDAVGGMGGVHPQLRPRQPGFRPVRGPHVPVDPRRGGAEPVRHNP